MKNKIFLLFLFLLPALTFAQLDRSIYTGTQNIRSLTVGDPVPDVEIAHIMNDIVTNSRLSAYKDQLLILDFWTTGCGSCIESFVKMSALQHDFGSQIKVMAVTYQKEPRIKKFFETNQIGRETKQVTAVEEKTLYQLFKHSTEPFEVWIYKGIVVARTQPEYVTKENIQFILDGHKPDWPVINDYEKTDAASKGFGVDSTNTAKSYTSLTIGFKSGRLVGIHSTKVDPVTKMREDTLFSSIANCYSFIWRSLGKSVERLAFNVADTSKYEYHERFGYRTAWMYKNYMKYVSVYPDRGLGDSLEHKTMLADLDRLLGLETHWEKRKVNCFILVKGVDSLKSNQPVSLEGVQENDAASVVLFRYNLNQTVEESFATSLHIPVINNENYYPPNTFKMRLKRTDLKDLASIKRALKPYNIEIQEGVREFEYFVISEIGYQPKNITAQIK